MQFVEKEACENEDDSVLDIKLRKDLTTIKYRNKSDGTITTKTIDTEEFCTSVGSQNMEYTLDIPRVNPSVPYCAKIGVSGNYRVYMFIYPPEVHRMYLLWNNSLSSKLDQDFSEFLPTEEEHNTILDSTDSIDYYRAFDIPYPALAIYCVFSKYTGSNNKENIKYIFQEQYVVAIKNYFGNVLDSYTYRFPFTNVYTDGRCCLGDINKRVKSVNNIAYYPTTIFNGIGNSDLCCYKGEHFNNENKDENSVLGKVMNEYELITKLGSKGINHFPIDYLKENTNLTVEGLFNRILSYY